MAHSKESRSDEYSDEAKRECATEHAKEDEQKRHVAALADEPGFDKIIHGADANAPNDHENAPTG